MADCTQQRAAAPSADVDPSGVPFAELAPDALRRRRTSLKWTRFADDVLPMFVAEMDFFAADAVREAIVDAAANSDFGYLDAAGPLATAFAGFARDRWGWQVREDFVHLATDVSAGIVEGIRAFMAAGRTRTAAAGGTGGRFALAVPTYPSFFEMLEELPFETVQVPLIIEQAGTAEPTARLDLAAIEREFASDAGVDVFLLCNPHNPHGLVHARDDLAALARLAARYGVLVVSDEIHAPLTQPDAEFVPFAPLAAEAGALAYVATSASKGWNIAGVKCSIVVAADERANAVLAQLPPEVACRASIIGLRANTAAFTDGRDWLDRTVAQVRANDELLAGLIAAHLPGVRYFRPRAGYLAWLDFSGTGIGDDPYQRILDEGRVAFNNGAAFGDGGAGHVRVNLACAPDTIREAVRRVAPLLPGAAGAGSAPHAPTAA